MGFNLGTSSNTGKLHMTDFLKTDNAVQNTEKEIPINQLVPWENQPFKMYSEFKLHELAESIKENGLKRVIKNLRRSRLSRIPKRRNPRLISMRRKSRCSVRKSLR